MMRLAATGFAAVAACLALAGPAAAADRDHDHIFDNLEARLAGGTTQPVIVTLDEPATAAQVSELERAVGTLRDVKRLHIIPAFSASATPEQVRDLAAQPGVKHVEYDAPAKPFAISDQTAFGVTSARADIPGLDGTGMVAAVVDTGIDPSWPDLTGGKVIAFKDLVGGQANAYDDLGHGSAVSSILAGTGASGPEGRGVAPAAKL